MSGLGKGALLDESIEQRLGQTDAAAIRHQAGLLLSQKGRELLFSDSAAKSALLGTQSGELQHFCQKGSLKVGCLFTQAVSGRFTLRGCR
jgi:hypothetical protein